MNIIGLSGVATCGKDFFFSHLKLATKKNVIRFGLADALKEELYDLIKQTYNVDVFNCTPEQKEMVRPILINHAAIRRKETHGRYWINKINDRVKSAAANKDNIVVVTDIRFAEFEKDEVFWLKKELSGFLIHISKYYVENDKKIFVPPANVEESKNNPELILNSDYIIEWPNNLGKVQAIEYCSDALVSMGLKKMYNNLLTSKK